MYSTYRQQPLTQFHQGGRVEGEREERKGGREGGRAGREEGEGGRREGWREKEGGREVKSKC